MSENCISSANENLSKIDFSKGPNFTFPINNAEIISSSENEESKSFETSMKDNSSLNNCCHTSMINENLLYQNEIIRFSPIFWESKYHQFGDISLVSFILDGPGHSYTKAAEFQPIMWGYDPLAEDYLIKNIVELVESIPESPGREGGFTPMHAAAVGGHLEVLQTLIGTGKANIEVKNGANCTCLRVACRHGHAEMVQYLVDIGAKVTGILKSDICSVEKCNDSNAKREIFHSINTARKKIGLSKLK